jgi:hypothetical protein
MEARENNVAGKGKERVADLITIACTARYVKFHHNTLLRLHQTKSFPSVCRPGSIGWTKRSTSLLCNPALSQQPGFDDLSQHDITQHCQENQQPVKRRQLIGEAKIGGKR